MGGIADVATGLAGRVDNIVGLHTYSSQPDTIQSPAAWVTEESGPEQVAFGDCWAVDFSVTVAVQVADLTRAQAQIRPYRSATGSSSIIAAILGDETLGGNAAFVTLGRWDRPSLEKYNDVPYLMSTLPVRVDYSE